MKSVTRSALLRSSILLSSLSAISAQDVCPGMIAYEVPYLAVYPVSISTYIAANTVFNINGNGYITINNAPTNLQTVITATSTVTSTVTSTATTTTTAAAANTAVPSGVVTTIAQPILLDGVPGTTSRIMRRQQSGTYLGPSGNVEQGSCTQGAAFFLTNGQLTLNGLVFSANTATANYALFEASSTVGNVASGFYSNNGVLGWNNTNFDNGIARFCSTGTSFYAVYKGSYPSGCTPFIFEIEVETACSGYGSTTISGSTTASGSTSGSATISGSVTGSVTSPTTTASISISGSSGSSSGTGSTGSTASASSASASASTTLTGSLSITSSLSASTTLTGSLSITSGLSASTTLTGSLSITSASSVSNSSSTAASSTTTNTANPTIPTDLPAGATPVVVSFSVPGLSKRQSGGTRYLKSDGTFTADKTQAAVLGLLNGTLYGGDTPYSTNPGTDSEVFAVYDDIGTITSLFSLTNGLTWANGNFSINTANTAEFAVVSSTIYAAFNSLPAGATVVTASASTFSTVIGQSSSSSSAGVSTVSASLTSGSVSASTGSGSGSTTPASTTSGTVATSSSASTTGSTSKSSAITSSSSSTTFTSSSAPYGNSTSSIISTSSSNSTVTKRKLR